MLTRIAPIGLAYLQLTACSGNKPGPGEYVGETGDTTPGADTSEPGETGGGGEDTDETGWDEYGWGKFDGVFMLGEMDDAWTCVNYFYPGDQIRWEGELCPECEFGMTITTEYVPEWVVDVYPACAWEDLASWTLGDVFETTWAFAPAHQLTYYMYEGTWYPFAEYTTEVEGYSDKYISWTFTDSIDESGTHEVGVFIGFFNNSSYD